MTATMAAAAGSRAQASTLTIEVERAFTGREVLRDVRVVVDGDTIVAVEPRQVPSSQGAGRLLVFPEATLLPGLIDAHVHLYLLARARSKAARAAKTPASADALLPAAVAVADCYLAAGVTTVRDLGDRLRLNLQVRDFLSARGRGGRPGPRVLAPGRALHREGHYGSFIGTGVADAGQIVALAEAELAAGADFLKVVASGIIDFKQAAASAPLPFSTAELRHLTSWAHARHVRVAAHASGAEAVATALAGGADFVEHGFFAGPDAVAALRGGAATWVPTFVPVDVVAAGGALAELSAEERSAVGNIVQRHAATLRQVYAAGGQVIAGSDAGSPGVWQAGAIIGELRCLHRAGLAPQEVLSLATQRAAAALGLGHLTGSIEPGKRADLLVVGGNPLDSLDALVDVRLVLRDGVLVAR